MKKALIFALAIIMGIGSAAAQVENEVEVGMNLSSMSKLDSKIGFHLGYRLTKHLPSLFEGAYLNGGALLTLKGAEKDYGSDLDFKCNAYYLEIPIHFGYKHVLSENLSLFGEFGPYLGIGLFGKTKLESGGESAKVDTFGDEGGVKRFDLGLGFRLGFEIQERVPVSFGYDFGLLNAADTDDGPSIKNSNFTVSVGYKF